MMKEKTIIKLKKITAVTIVLLTCTICLPNKANAIEIKPQDIATKDNISFPGEPYGLAGNRMIFTNWYYIYSGNFKWYDKHGEGLPQITWGAFLGPWDAEYRPKDVPRGIKLVAQPAKRLGPLVKQKYPWEHKGLSFATVLKDGSGYKAWGPCEDAEGKRRMAYYESKDGIKWTRPELGLVEYKGSKKNNLINLEPRLPGESGGNSFFGWGVFIDPSASTAERYKATKSGKISHEEFAKYLEKYPDDWNPKGYRGGVWKAMRGAVSPDGINWKLLPQPLTIEHCDTQIVVYYDQQLKKYVLFTRHHMVGPRSNKALTEWNGIGSWGDPARRAIGRSESKDFRHFKPSERILSPSPSFSPSQHLYNNCRTCIPGAPETHLMFPSVFDHADDTTTVILLSSFDTKEWHYVPGPPMLETDNFGKWDGGCVFAHPDMIELPDGTFALPYTGYKFPHKYPRGKWQFLPGYATWPKGRLIALEAEDIGEFMTVAFIPPGKKMKINAVTKRAGKILVEVVSDSEDKVLAGRTFEDCDPIIGDKFWVPVTYKGSDYIGHKKNQAIKLRFKLEKAKIAEFDQAKANSS